MAFCSCDLDEVEKIMLRAVIVNPASFLPEGGAGPGEHYRRPEGEESVPGIMQKYCAEYDRYEPGYFQVVKRPE